MTDCSTESTKSNEPPSKKRKTNKSTGKKKNGKFANLLLQLPKDVLVYQTVQFIEASDLLSLSRINRQYHSNNLARECGDAWKAAHLQILEQEDIEFNRHKPLDPYNYKSLVSLYVDIGCEVCHKPRIRKVYYPVMHRVCSTCIRENTISDYSIDQKYNYDGLKEMRKKILNLPSYDHELWNKYIGTYTLSFYWLPDVQRIVDQYANQITSAREESKRRQDQKEEEDRQERLTKSKRKRKKNLIIRNLVTMDTFEDEDLLQKCAMVDRCTDQVCDPEYQWSSKSKRRLLEPVLNQINLEYNQLLERKRDQEQRKEIERLVKEAERLAERERLNAQFNQWALEREELERKERMDQEAARREELQNLETRRLEEIESQNTLRVLIERANVNMANSNRLSPEEIERVEKVYRQFFPEWVESEIILSHNLAWFYCGSCPQFKRSKGTIFNSRGLINHTRDVHTTRLFEIREKILMQLPD